HNAPTHVAQGGAVRANVPMLVANTVNDEVTDVGLVAVSAAFPHLRGGLPLYSLACTIPAATPL
ncbi:hypothetical protein, partial [Streptomyces sp. KL115B]|uniref:hypothetical protein n=1 Tax=Streptomyces sp. KL115B TaxID=3045154 RepID=UPI00279607FB